MKFKPGNLIRFKRDRFGLHQGFALVLNSKENDQCVDVLTFDTGQIKWFFEHVFEDEILQWNSHLETLLKADECFQDLSFWFLQSIFPTNHMNVCCSQNVDFHCRLATFRLMVWTVQIGSWTGCNEISSWWYCQGILQRWHSSVDCPGLKGWPLWTHLSSPEGFGTSVLPELEGWRNYLIWFPVFILSLRTFEQILTELPSCETLQVMKVAKLVVNYHAVSINGPDIETYWTTRGRIHRCDGPAYSLSSGIREWWRCGKRIKIEFVGWNADLWTIRTYQNWNSHLERLGEWSNSSSIVLGFEDGRQGHLVVQFWIQT